MNTKHKNLVLTLLMALIFFGFFVVCCIKSPDIYSYSERRVLAVFPELNIETISSGDFMDEFEEYSLDQFPLRDNFRSIKALTSFGIFQQAANNDIYICDGYISEIDYPLNSDMLDHASERFRFIYDTYIAGSDANVYFSIIPDKNYFLAEPNGYLSINYDLLFEYMRERNQYMEYIDITGTLSITDYYKTDSHWRQECILDTANVIAEAMDSSLSATHEENVLLTPFYGVYHGQSALPNQPDTIVYLTNDIINNCTVTCYDSGQPITLPMYDMDAAEGKDPYELFLSGAKAILTIENHAAENDRELLVFRDSFSSSLVPLLVENYSKITLIDIRYVHSGMLGNFIEFSDQDVLFIYSTMLLNNSLALK